MRSLVRILAVSAAVALAIIDLVCTLVVLADVLFGGFGTAAGFVVGTGAVLGLFAGYLFLPILYRFARGREPAARTRLHPAWLVVGGFCVVCGVWTPWAFGLLMKIDSAGGRARIEASRSLRHLADAQTAYVSANARYAPDLTTLEYSVAWPTAIVLVAGDSTWRATATHPWWPSLSCTMAAEWTSGKERQADPTCTAKCAWYEAWMCHLLRFP